MKENPLGHKYIKVGDKTDPMVKEGTKPDNGNSGYGVNNDVRQNYRGNKFRRNFRGLW